MASHLSKNVRRKWWDVSDSLPHGRFDLGLNGRVGVHCLENAFLQVHLIFNSTVHLLEVFAEDGEGDKGQNTVQHSTHEKDLGIPVHLDGFPHDIHGANTFGSLQRVGTCLRNSSLIIGSH